jgi:hypothetical protein
LIALVFEGMVVFSCSGGRGSLDDGYSIFQRTDRHSMIRIAAWLARVKLRLSGTREVWGLRFELAGLLLVLAATIWQANITDWWDEQLREWQALIQEDTNLALLVSVGNLEHLETTKDDYIRQQLAIDIKDRTSRVANKIIEDRQRRPATMSEGQAGAAAKVRRFLLIFGAGLVAVGKWTTMSAVRNRIF